jgi:hypothetical protein
MGRGSSLRIFYRLSPDNVNCRLHIDISSDDLPEDPLEETKAISNFHVRHKQALQNPSCKLVVLDSDDDIETECQQTLCTVA